MHFFCYVVQQNSIVDIIVVHKNKYKHLLGYIVFHYT
jgi:hypothetical protein